jgi:ribA/ribD-fused uncharacterized protein
MSMIGFYGHTNTTGKVNKSCLSNFYPAKFTYRGHEFPTSEHALMASKAALFWDFDKFQMILKTDSPRSAKAYGRQVKNFNEDIWWTSRYFIMVDILLAKFGQNQELKEFLLSTEASTLVECSPSDKIWGVGLSLSDPSWENKENWQGKNLLGYALMYTRSKLQDIPNVPSYLCI